MASVPLERLQRWMQGVVAYPGPTDEALAAPAVVSEIANVGDVILPSRTLAAAERLSIYHGMYLLRMEEALASDYPGLKSFLGDDAFFELARDYVQVYPSRSYTFNRLGDHLPEFLINARGRRHRRFLVELARVELAVTEVFDAPQEEPLAEAQIAAVAPDDWARTVLRPVPAFRLLGCSTNAHDFLQATKEARRRPPRPRLRETWLAVSRRNYSVYRLELSRTAYALLSDLAAGTAVGPAIQAALARERRRPQEQQFFRWFRDWVSSGIFASMQVLPG